MFKNRLLLTSVSLIVILIIAIGCNTRQTEKKDSVDIIQVPTPLPVQLLSPVDTEEVAEEDIEERLEPKYIFYVIGDGMGMAHLRIGDLYKKVETGDMSRVGTWESFECKNIVSAGADSSRGGTMLSTGMAFPSGPIAWDDGIDYTTIMDIAKSYGFATGVVTQADITDATPATFLSHSDSRRKNVALANDIFTSNVDFIMGGGLDSMFSNKTSDYMLDWSNNKVYTDGKHIDAHETLKENGYTVYLGMEGLDPFYSEIIHEKTVYAVEEGNLPFNYIRKQKDNSQEFKNLPELSEIVQKAIDSLIFDEDGFIIMVEQSTIDDAGHVKTPSFVAAEMGVMEDTLITIMDFYQEHPDDTLVILTADHETGDHVYNETKFLEASNIKETLPWDGSIDNVNEFLRSNFGVQCAEKNLTLSNEYLANDFFGNEFENKMCATSSIVVAIEEALSIKIQTDYHSNQDVPLYATGFGSQSFLTADSIQDISHILCDIMDWEDILGTPAQ